MEINQDAPSVTGGFAAGRSAKHIPGKAGLGAHSTEPRKPRSSNRVPLPRRVAPLQKPRAGSFAMKYEAGLTAATDEGSRKRGARLLERFLVSTCEEPRSVGGINLRRSHQDCSKRSTPPASTTAACAASDPRYPLNPRCKPIKTQKENLCSTWKKSVIIPPFISGNMF